jgi:8-oxo-dGTP diphosphatase
MTDMTDFTYKYPKADNTLDIVIFTIRKGRLKLLLIKRGREGEPFYDHWAIPGGFLNIEPHPEPDPTLEHGAHRELTEETSLEAERDNVFLEQLYTYGDMGRDPRGRVITVAYYALISPDAFGRVKPKDDAKEAEWFDVEELPAGLAFDHAKILAMALERVRGKIDYDPRIARGLLPEEFTSKEFRRVHEVVKGVTYDRSNFNKRFKRMVEDGRFMECGETKELASSGRPPNLYRFPS